MSADATEPTYKVGRGKPPIHTQFKPGQSGNPRGRPRGSGDFRQALRKAGNAKVEVTENGRKRRCTKLEVATTQLVNKAAAGDLKAVALVGKYGSALEAEPAKTSPADHTEASFGSEDDQAVWESFLARFKEGSS